MSDIAESSLTREMKIDDAIDYASKNLTGFGSAYLDDALIGIMPNDLMLLGARSGIGKTQLALSIAAYNANACKKNVVFIALEAEAMEIEMRLRYSIEASLYFKDQNRDRSIVISYRKWRLGFLQQALKQYKEEAIGIFIQRYSRLHTVYRTEYYDIKSFERTLDETKDFGELFILDHLMFFDLESGPNENSQVSVIMKRIRTMNLYLNKPFIVVAHLRKNIEGLIPGLEDFMGSSDIGKMCTVAVMLAKDTSGYDAKNQMQKTIISIPKARTGALGNLVGITEYSLRHQMYLPNYTLARVTGLNNRIEELNGEELPDWSTKAKIKVQAQKS